MDYVFYLRHKAFLSAYRADAPAPEVCIRPRSKRVKLCHETPSATERLIVFVPFDDHTIANRDSF